MVSGIGGGVLSLVVRVGAEREEKGKKGGRKRRKDLIPSSFIFSRPLEWEKRSPNIIAFSGGRERGGKLRCFFFLRSGRGEKIRPFPSISRREKKAGRRTMATRGKKEEVVFPVYLPRKRGRERGKGVFVALYPKHFIQFGGKGGRGEEGKDTFLPFSIWPRREKGKKGKGSSGDSVKQNSGKKKKGGLCDRNGEEKRGRGGGR